MKVLSPPPLSLSLPTPLNRLRRAVHWVVTKKVFDMFIMFVIVLSSIALSMEDPVDGDSVINQILEKADYGFTAIFTLECTLKVRAVARPTNWSAPSPPGPYNLPRVA